MSNVISVTHFECGICRKAYRDKAFAESCCKCLGCGKPSDRRHIMYNRCDDCRRSYEANRAMEMLEKAEEITGYDSWLYDEQSNRFFQDMEDAAESLFECDPRPEFLFACKPEQWAVMDADNIIVNMQENSCLEDPVDPEMTKELFEFAEKFNKANEKTIAYSPDYKRKVRIDYRDQEHYSQP